MIRQPKQRDNNQRHHVSSTPMTLNATTGRLHRSPIVVTPAAASHNRDAERLHDHLVLHAQHTPDDEQLLPFEEDDDDFSNNQPPLVLDGAQFGGFATPPPFTGGPPRETYEEPSPSPPRSGRYNSDRQQHVDPTSASSPPALSPLPQASHFTSSFSHRPTRKDEEGNAERPKDSSEHHGTNGMPTMPQLRRDYAELMRARRAIEEQLQGLRGVAIEVAKAHSRKVQYDDDEELGPGGRLSFVVLPKPNANEPDSSSDHLQQQRTPRVRWHDSVCDDSKEWRRAQEGDEEAPEEGSSDLDIEPNRTTPGQEELATTDNVASPAPHPPTESFGVRLETTIEQTNSGRVPHDGSVFTFRSIVQPNSSSSELHQPIDLKPTTRRNSVSPPSTFIDVELTQRLESPARAREQRSREIPCGRQRVQGGVFTMAPLRQQ